MLLQDTNDLIHLVLWNELPVLRLQFEDEIRFQRKNASVGNVFSRRKTTYLIETFHDRNPYLQLFGRISAIFRTSKIFVERYAGELAEVTRDWETEDQCGGEVAELWRGEILQRKLVERFVLAHVRQTHGLSSG